MVKSLQSRGLVLRPSLHKRILELAAEMGDPVRAGQAVSAIKRSGQHLSATAYSRYIIANAKARVSDALSADSTCDVYYIVRPSSNPLVI